MIYLSVCLSGGERAHAVQRSDPAHGRGAVRPAAGEAPPTCGVIPRRPLLSTHETGLAQRFPQNALLLLVVYLTEGGLWVGAGRMSAGTPVLLKGLSCHQV